jgi:hypothetical protein
MSITSEHPRWKPYKLLLLFFEEHDITMRDAAEQLGLKSDYAVRKFLKSEYMPTDHHAKLVKLGVPAELLPTPMDRKPGPKPGGRVPRWPGLMQSQDAEASPAVPA